MRVGLFFEIVHACVSIRWEKFCTRALLCWFPLQRSPRPLETKIFSKPEAVIFSCAVLTKRTKRMDKGWNLEARKVARTKRTAAMLAQRRADQHPVQKEQSSFGKMVDDMAQINRVQENRRKRLRQCIQMPTAGCIMKKPRSVVFPMRTNVPLKMETASREVMARNLSPMQAFPITKQRSEQQVAPFQKEEKRRYHTRMPVSSPREVTSSRRAAHRHLSTPAKVDKKPIPFIFETGDSNNSMNDPWNLKQQPSVSNAPWNLKQQPSVSNTADFVMGSRPLVSATRKKFRSNYTASIASSTSSSHLFGTQSLSDTILTDFKAVEDAFGGMSLVGDSFLHIGCILGECLRLPGFLKKDNSVNARNNKDTMNVSVIHNTIITETSVPDAVTTTTAARSNSSNDSSTLTESSMDCTTLNGETMTTFDTDTLENGSSTFSDNSSYTFSDGDSSSTEQDNIRQEMKHHGSSLGVKKPKMKRIIKSPTATTTTTKNGETSTTASSTEWKAVQHVGATRANRSRRRP